MIIPKLSSIYVLGISYRIECDGVERGENRFCRPTKRVSGIREGLCEDEEVQVFLHEDLHAMLAGLAQFDLYEDESYVQDMAMGLKSVIDSIVPESRFRAHRDEVRACRGVRAPSGAETCAFCRMLVSRGFVY